MKRSIICRDIVELPSDALIYSTNVRLMLTGGVGAAILKKFGIRVQIELQDQSLGSGRQMADVGEVLETRIPGSPWKRVFHTIATDEMYRTDPQVVRAILLRCLRRCAESADLRAITCSALGAGYGDLELTAFVAIADEVCSEFEDSGIQSFAVVSRDPDEFGKLLAVAATFPKWRTNEG